MDFQTLEPDLYCLMNKHYTPGRPGPIKYLVVHHNAGVNLSTADCYRIWQDREASAHYQVEVDGTIGQLVNDWDTAWHAGDSAANSYSIGIEHANTGGAAEGWPISQETINAGAPWLPPYAMPTTWGNPPGSIMCSHTRISTAPVAHTSWPVPTVTNT